MSTFFNKLKSFVDTDAGKWTIFILASVIAGLITNKIIDKTKE